MRPTSPAPATPASLTQPEARSDARCPACGSARLTQITMTLTDGSPVDFASCHECEHKSWLAGGVALPLNTVLAKATKRKVAALRG